MFNDAAVDRNRDAALGDDEHAGTHRTLGEHVLPGLRPRRRRVAEFVLQFASVFRSSEFLCTGAATDSLRAAASFACAPQALGHDAHQHQGELGHLLQAN
jgi:hypothetical protein